MSLSTELLDEIVDYLDEIGDVVALGLTCRRLKAVTIPFPLNFRSLLWPFNPPAPANAFRMPMIDLPLHGVSLPTPPNSRSERVSLDCEEWLDREPRQWRAIRTLVIDPFRDTPLPKFMHRYVMPSYWEPPVDILTQEEAWNHPRRRIYLEEKARLGKLVLSTSARILQRIPLLLSLTWNGMFPSKGDCPFLDALATQTALRHGSFSISEPGVIIPTIGADPLVSRLLDTLRSCTKLQELSMSMPMAKMTHQMPIATIDREGWSDTALHDQIWPELHTLELGNMDLMGSTCIKLSVFLERQPSLTHLRLSSCTMRLDNLVARSFARLTHLDVDVDVTSVKQDDIMALARQVSGLQHLAIPDAWAGRVVREANAMFTLPNREGAPPGDHFIRLGILPFLASHRAQLETWTTYFSQSPRLQSLVLRCDESRYPPAPKPQNPSEAEMTVLDDEALVEVLKASIPGVTGGRVQLGCEEKKLEVRISCVR